MQKVALGGLEFKLALLDLSLSLQSLQIKTLNGSKQKNNIIFNIVVRAKCFKFTISFNL